jgi:hypothetical protein
VITRPMVLVVAFLLAAPAIGRAQSADHPPAAEVVKAVIYNELHPSTVSEAHWRYRLEKEVGGKRETREVVETRSGSV